MAFIGHDGGGAIAEIIGFIENGAKFIGASGVIFGVLWKWAVMPRLKDTVIVWALEAVNKAKESDVDKESYIGRKLAYEGVFGGIEKKLDELGGKIDKTGEMAEENRANYLKIALSAKRAELLLLVNDHPENIEAINLVYREYKEAGGNSYMDDVMGVWRDEYEMPVIERKIKRKRGDK